MKYSDFSKGVKECPDKDLTEKFGINDNFPIICGGKTTLEETTKLILKSRKYKFHSFEEDTDYKIFPPHIERELVEKMRHIYSKQLLYIPGTIIIGPRKNVEITRTNSFDRTFSNHKLQQTQNYSFTLMLHPYQKKIIDGISWIRALGNVLTDICDNILIPNSIPFCLPKVFSYNGEIETQDYSTIVYWPDNIETEMCRK